MRTVAFLESLRGVESLFTRGLRHGARDAGWKTSMVALRDHPDRARSVKEIRAELLAQKPDVICFLMDAPLHLPDLWDDRAFAGIDKISLWFDDYLRSPKTMAHPETWTHWQKENDVRVGFWDGYWREEWECLTGGAAFPVHLAANPRMLDPEAAPWEEAWSERAAFVGTVPSLHSLHEVGAGLSRPLQNLLAEVLSVLPEAPWPLRPYQLAEEVRGSLAPKLRLALEAALQKIETRALWHHLLWRWGKRIARLRGLAALGQAGPLAVLSGHGIERYAGEDELRASLPASLDFVYADTRAVPAGEWSRLFRTGKFQVQITDPQSIESGLPFRIFECAACAKPLLTDSRPGLAAVFPTPSGLVIASGEADLAFKAAQLFAQTSGELVNLGRQSREQFLVGHTWRARWEQIAYQPAPFLVPVPTFSRGEAVLQLA